MASALVGISMFTIVSSATTNFLINSLTKTADTVCCSMKRIAVINHPSIVEIRDKLVTMDLLFFINIIQKLVEQHIDKEASLALKEALYGVNEILENINTELSTIMDAIDNHGKKYFSQWRYFNCDCNIDIIIGHEKILKKRYEILIDLLQIELHK